MTWLSASHVAVFAGHTAPRLRQRFPPLVLPSHAHDTVSIELTIELTGYVFWNVSPAASARVVLPVPLLQVPVARGWLSPTTPSATVKILPQVILVASLTTIDV